MREGVYQGFDALGRRLRIAPRDPLARADTSVMAGQVSVSLEEDNAEHSEELRNVLLRYLRDIVASDRIPQLTDLPANEATLGELLALVMRFAVQE